jgi:GNAT superfamily N-acetyltransferase
MSAITVTRAKAADIPVVRRLAHAIWHRHYPGIISVAQIDYMLARGYSDDALRRFVDTRGSGLAVAAAEGEPVGFAAWLAADAPATTKLDKLYVLPDRHGQGIGRRLIEHVEAAARAGGATTLVLNVNKRNAGAIAAYRRCGFAIRDEVVVDIGQGFVMDDYVMAKALPA